LQDLLFFLFRYSYVDIVCSSFVHSATLLFTVFRIPSSPLAKRKDFYYKAHFV